MSGIDQQIENSRALEDALKVTRGGIRPALNDGVAKLLGFFLREGECDAWVLASNIEVRFSWLQKGKPSSYLGSLAPGLVTQLMDFGGIEAINKDEVSFAIGPGECCSGRYHFSFERKWILIRIENDRILIRVRNKKSALSDALERFGAQTNG